MAIIITCPCGKRMQTSEEFAGRTVRCPGCGQNLIVPQTSAPKAPPIAEVYQEPPASSGRDRPRREVERDPDEMRPRSRGRRYEDDDYEDDYRVRRRRSSETSGKAIACLVLSLFSICVPWLTALIALILGIFGLRDIGRSNGRITGKGLAIAGIVISILTSLAYVPFTYFFIQGVNDGKDRAVTQNNLHQIGIAMHNYESSNLTLPPAATCDKSGKPLLSWRVALLPFLFEDSLYRQFKLDEPWDSPNNMALLAKMPKVYAAPRSNRSSVPEGYTYYRVFVGPKTAFEPVAGNPQRGNSLMSFEDGTSNTILVVEADEAVPWTKPDELPYAADQPLPKLGGVFNNGYYALFADGTVHFFRTGSVSDRDLRGYITRNGGEIVLYPP